MTPNTWQAESSLVPFHKKKQLGMRLKLNLPGSDHKSDGFVDLIQHINYYACTCVVCDAESYSALGLVWDTDHTVSILVPVER